MNQLAGVVTITSREGKADELAALLSKMHSEAVNDDGCDLYSVVRLDRDPDTFVLVEFYRDQQSLEAHQQNPALRALGATMSELVAAMSIKLGSSVAGDVARRG